ncbi:mycofactocin-coupled SDR family oxidoreductase [Mycobacterium sp. HNNTM2301]|uniref:mycofactocin-coupled SDR family oxidoreductase n=1 Tax=Mycobacterium hainanense TaxID=3289775 RepID=UPI0035A60576
MQRLEGKVAFITGAARGQGRAHAVRMAQEGAEIIAIDACTTVGPNVGATLTDFDETVKRVETLGRRICWSQVDIRDYEGISAALNDGVDRFGRLDVVVCNAGISSGGPATELSEQYWQDMIDINLTGQWKTCKAAIPHLIASGGGSISIISSFAGLNGMPTGASYCSAKTGLIGLMRVLAIEHGKHNIRVNTIHPSNVVTPMLINDEAFKHFRPDLENPTLEDFEQAAKRVHLLPVPYVQPEDIANAAIFLASDEGRFITGVTLPVDAGANLKRL